MKESKVWYKVEAEAKKRLEADAKDTLIRQIELILFKLGIKRSERNDRPVAYPKEYVKYITKGGAELANKVRTTLSTLGFNFKPVAMHTPDTDAMSATGTYRTLDYIVDVVFRHDELKVDIYF